LPRVGLALAAASLMRATTVHAAPPGDANLVEAPVLYRPAPKPVEDLQAPRVLYNKWRGTGYGAYLAPKDLDVGADGGVDVMLHLNGAMLAEKEWRESGLNAVVASIAIREVVGSAGYAKLFSDPGYLDWVLGATLADLRKNGVPQATRVRRLGVTSWSAGMGGVSQLIGRDAWRQRLDSVVLLDSLHATYADPKTGVAFVKNPEHAVMGLGVDWVDTKVLGKYTQFAKDAASGKRVFVTAASSILPPDYASCRETSIALLRAVGTDADPVRDEAKNALGMSLRFRADKGELHFRGYAGGGPHDHFDQLHLVGEMVRTFVAPRWNRLAAEERRQFTASQ
jgi:hypothetical protein